MSKKKVKSTPKKAGSKAKPLTKKVVKKVASKKVAKKSAKPQIKKNKPTKAKVEKSNTKKKPNASKPIAKKSVKKAVAPKKVSKTLIVKQKVVVKAKNTNSNNTKGSVSNRKPSPALPSQKIEKSVKTKTVVTSEIVSNKKSNPVPEKNNEIKSEAPRAVIARTFTEKKKVKDDKPKIAQLVQDKVKPSASIDAPSIGTSYSNVSKPGDNRNLPEPKGKFELEYVVHSSASILYEFLTSPSGLSEWFCDDVNIRNGIFSFIWDGSVQMARLVRQIEDKSIRFQWTEKNDGSFFEFRIEKDDLTNDISLIVTDFADSAEEKASSKLLWDSQIDKLLQVLGSHF